jgi:hypothetical protein
MQKFSKSIDKNKKCFKRFVSDLLIYMRLLFCSYIDKQLLIEEKEKFGSGEEHCFG